MRVRTTNTFKYPPESAVRIVSSSAPEWIVLSQPWSDDFIQQTPVARQTHIVMLSTFSLVTVSQVSS